MRKPSKRRKSPRGLWFFASLRPERKVPRTIEGDRILQDPELREEAYRRLRKRESILTK